MSRRNAGAGPIVVLALVALVPALVLWSAWRWADGQATAHDAAPPPSAEAQPAPVPATALSTSLASWRRLPVPLAHDVNLRGFSGEVEPLLAAVNERSCVSISVDGREVGERQADLPVIPASVMKVMVAAAALEILGEQHRFETTVVGELDDDGVVRGDLYLVGGGDPLLSGDWYPTSGMERFPVFNHTSLDELADRVVAAGVASVEGGIVGDGSRYDDEYYAPGWAPGIAGVEAGPYSGLIANDSRVLNDDLRASDPREAAGRELIRMLADRGVSVGGGATAGSAPAVGGSVSVIASIESVELPGVVAEMLTTSDNNTAEMLVKELGVATRGEGTRAAGLEAMLSVFAEWGIDLAGVELLDGSGLSPGNLLTCRSVVEVLQRFDASGALGSGLPVAGTTGTLTGAFTDGPVTGRLLGKTGTLNNPPFNQDPPAVKGLAGYLPIDGGGAIEYVLLLNGPTISDQSEYRPVWDLLARSLATYPSGAGPDVLGPR